MQLSPLTKGPSTPDPALRRRSSLPIRSDFSYLSLSCFLPGPKGGIIRVKRSHRAHQSQASQASSHKTHTCRRLTADAATTILKHPVAGDLHVQVVPTTGDKPVGAAANPTALVDRDQSQDALGVSMCPPQHLATSAQPRLLKACMAVSCSGFMGGSMIWTYRCS